MKKLFIIMALVVCAFNLSATDKKSEKKGTLPRHASSTSIEHVIRKYNQGNVTGKTYSNLLYVLITMKQEQIPLTQYRKKLIDQALLQASADNQCRAAQLLVDIGANVHCTTPRSGRTPLTLATTQKMISILTSGPRQNTPQT